MAHNNFPLNPHCIRIVMEEIKTTIRDIPDFPKEGIIFKDITPLLGHGDMFKKVIDHLADRYKDKQIDRVVGIEARGFIFAASVAYALGVGCVLVRKPGKLPYKTYQTTYALEYGTDTIEIHQDAVEDGERILLLDDVLATGGTMAAANELISKNFKADVVEAAFIMELNFLNGRDRLNPLPIHSLIQY